MNQTDRTTGFLPSGVSIIPSTMYLVPNEEFSTLATSLWAAWSRRAEARTCQFPAENPKRAKNWAFPRPSGWEKDSKYPMIFFGGNDPFSGVWKLHSAGIFRPPAFGVRRVSRTTPAFSHDESRIFPVKTSNFLRSISSRRPEVDLSHQAHGEARVGIDERQDFHPPGNIPAHGLRRIA